MIDKKKRLEYKLTYKLLISIQTHSKNKEEIFNKSHTTFVLSINGEKIKESKTNKEIIYFVFSFCTNLLHIIKGYSYLLIMLIFFIFH